MIRSSFMTLASAALFSFACAQAAPAHSEQSSVAMQVHQPGTGRQHPQYRALAQKRHRAVRTRQAKPTPLSRVVAANRDAVREPQTDFYIGAVQVYPWSEGALYRLYSAPEQISDLALQPGENLLSIAAGDTARWIIGETASGSGAGRRMHILVKPVAPRLRTNLVIATDRRTYHVGAISTVKTAMAMISWTYPEESMAIVRSASAPTPAPAVSPVDTIENLNFGYRIEGDNASWRPVRAFDDGHQTFIEFPPTLGDSQAPPLFVIDAAGKAELVNYRLKGHFYIVDRLFAAAELRLGEKRQQVVRIIRENAAPQERRAA